MSAAEERKIDPAMVTALYVEHGEELRRFLVGVLRDGQLVQDVLQCTFAKVLERGHEVQPGRETSRSGRGWLYRSVPRS